MVPCLRSRLLGDGVKFSPWFRLGAVLAIVCPGGVWAGGTPLRTVEVAGGLSFPVYVTHAPGDYARIFVLTKAGRIYVVKAGQRLAEPFLDIDDLSSAINERGLLGMAFHPDYPAVNAFFINYTDNNGDTVIARYAVSQDPDIADPDGDAILMISQPAANHNGGWLEFGPDGYLYIALGDGGGQRDPNGRGQNTVGELLGNILRIDVDSDAFPADPLRDYAIPPDNPFVGVDGEDEIWAYGLRNPWRCAFDSATGDLFIADVGESEHEEINFEPFGSPGGANYGWRCFEGTECTSFGLCNCPAVDAVEPIHVYSHDNGSCSISGGEVYRGCAIPDLAGAYFFGDFCTSQLWTLTFVDGQPLIEGRTSELTPEGGISGVSSFGKDAAGEVYICDYVGGKVLKVVSDPPLELAAADPPHKAIDARAPVEVDGVTPVGWDRVELVLSAELHCTTPADFSVFSEGGFGLSGPVVQAVELGAKAGEVAIMLDRPILAGSWLNVFHHESRALVRLGSLPGDVDSSRVTTPLDLLHLVDQINAAVGGGDIWSTDIDRSGSMDAADVAMLVGLVGGTVDGRIWLGVSLP